MEGVEIVLAAVLALSALLAVVLLLDRPGVEASREAPSFALNSRCPLPVPYSGASASQGRSLSPSN